MSLFQNSGALSTVYRRKLFIKLQGVVSLPACLKKGMVHRVPFLITPCKILPDILWQNEKLPCFAKIGGHSGEKPDAFAIVERK